MNPIDFSMFSSLVNSTLIRFWTKIFLWLLRPHFPSRAVLFETSHFYNRLPSDAFYQTASSLPSWLISLKQRKKWKKHLIKPPSDMFHLLSHPFCRTVCFLAITPPPTLNDDIRFISRNDFRANGLDKFQLGVHHR